MLHFSRRRLLLGAGALAAYAALSKEATPFWQSRDSNYNLSVGGAAPTPIAFVDGVETASTNGTSVTSAAINSTGANLLVRAVAEFGGGALGTFADSKGNSWTTLTSFVDGSNLSRIRMEWSSPTSVGAGHTVGYTVGAGGGQPSIAFAAFSNANATPFGSQVGTSGNSTSPAGGSITPGANNGLIITAFGGLSTAPITVDSSFIVVGTPAICPCTNNFALGMAYFIQTTAAAVNPIWTVLTGNPWAATNAVFKN